MRQTPLDAPRQPQEATRAGLDSRALVFTYSRPDLIARSKSVSELPKNPARPDWTGVTVGGKGAAS